MEEWQKSALAYAEIYKKDYQKYLIKNSIEDSFESKISFFVSERNNSKNKESAFVAKFDVVKLYREIESNVSGNDTEAQTSKIAIAYAETFHEDFNEFIKPYQDLLDNLSLAIAVFYISERNTNDLFPERIEKAHIHMAAKEAEVMAKLEERPNLRNNCWCDCCGTRLVRNQQLVKENVIDFKDGEAQCATCKHWVHVADNKLKNNNRR